MGVGKGVDNVENVDNSVNQEECTIIETVKEKTIHVKEHESFNESSLMTLPFISLKRKKVTEINRKWHRGNEEVGLRVVGSESSGCPTIYELDVLMALFKILSRNMENKIEVENVVLSENDITISQNHTVKNMPRVINFTYRGLAKEMGLKGFGNATKKRLEKSIECLSECTIYSTFAFRNAKEGEYVADFNGKKSCRILINYKSYEVKNFKRSGKKLLSPDNILEKQSVEIDSFFYDNMCNNYFKLYDYDKYKKLTKSIAKKLLLILTQWSTGFEKSISYEVLFNYIGIDFEEFDYYKYQLRYAIDELVFVNFIKAYIITDEGVIFIFNTTAKIKAQKLDKYTTDIEVVARLREIGISFDDIKKYCFEESMPYISALLRYVDYKLELKQVEDTLRFTQAGLPLNRYNVEKFIAKI